eukprot:TRINITY_DN28952_c0_g2_i1.p1 TRINITY_DN28952_c0_g2~~TRINITY_DN28952_c0_g2_i1.p1  ORF type:complete len:984 (-),score=189.48 TRINITY_DN28952_c0_g2_i1:61-2781(-)
MADIWLASWTPTAVVFAAGLPLPVRWELLTIPTELLFCDRALPLSDLDLWHYAAATLFDSCGAVFGHLIQEAPAAQGIGRPALQVLASWLRAARLSYQWLTGRARDEAAPVKALVCHGQALLALAAAAPEDACEVTQQLARWRKCDVDVSPLLGAFLELLFRSNFSRPRHDVLLPLLSDLAMDRWPRAATGDIELDWRAIAQHAIAAVRDGSTGTSGVASGVGTCAARATVRRNGEGVEEDTGESGEAGLAVWQTLATVLREGTREWSDEADHGGPHAEWFMPLEVLKQNAALPQLFSLLARELLEMLQAPASPTAAQLNSLWQVRSGAQSTVAAWARLVGDGPAWQEALWAPLQNVGRRLAPGATVVWEESLLREVEVVLWFSATLAASWRESADTSAPPAAVAVLELGPALDSAPAPWRALLWCAACSLASTAPAEQCPRLIEWMLQRSPQQAANGSVELLALTELSYATAVEMACRLLPDGGGGNGAVTERIAALALAEMPASMLHDDSSKARARLLGTIRHTMGGDATSLCQGLSTRVLPVLQAAAAAEAEAAVQTKQDLRWYAAQTVLATLAAVLPRRRKGGSDSVAGEGVVTSEDHPAVLLWREYWSCLEAAMLPRWRPLCSDDQPLAAAAEVLAAAAVSVPVLLPDALRLLVQSVEHHVLPDVQLRALHVVLLKVPCPPLDPAVAAELLLKAILGVTSSLLSRAKDMLESPETLTALFRVLAAALASGRGGLCDGRLRPMLLVQVTLVCRCVGLLNEMLPDCTSPTAAEQMLRFAVRLVTGDELQQPAYRDGLAGQLPGLCASLCRALALQEHLAGPEGVVDAAEILYRAADAFPTELPGALAIGLRHVEVPEWSREQLRKHVETRKEWPKRWEWTVQLQQIVSEWQSEHRQALKRKPT